MKKVLLVALCLAILTAPAVGGSSSTQTPPPMDAGSFEGTWYYTDTAYQLALFISRDKTGVMHIRYHLQAKEGNSFETDAGGFAKSIDSEGHLVEVVFTGSPVGANLIKGHFERTAYLSKKAKVRQWADFQMYRTESGRKLVLLYPEYVVETTDTVGRVSTKTDTDVYKLFRKASDIVVDFDEIQF